MPYCSKCGAESDKDTKFCPRRETHVDPLLSKPERRRIQREQRRLMSTLIIVFNGEFTTSQDAQSNLSGGSTLSIDGAANNRRISASMGSHLELSDFTVDNADVDLNEGSDATNSLGGRLGADLSGGSHLFYIGDPTMSDIDPSNGCAVESSHNGDISARMPS